MASEVETRERLPSVASCCSQETSCHLQLPVPTPARHPTDPFDPAIRADMLSAPHVGGAGTIDGVTVGYIAAHRQALHDGSAMARITDVYVLPDARGVGVGEALMLLVESWAREEALIGLDSIALPGDRATKNFFETFGLVARAIEVHRSLEQ